MMECVGLLGCVSVFGCVHVCGVSGFDQRASASTLVWVRVFQCVRVLRVCAFVWLVRLRSESSSICVNCGQE